MCPPVGKLLLSCKIGYTLGSNENEMKLIPQDDAYVVVFK